MPERATPTPAEREVSRGHSSGAYPSEGPNEWKGETILRREQRTRQATEVELSA